MVKPEARTPSRPSSPSPDGKGKGKGKKGVINENSYCFEFNANGACSKDNCIFPHLAPDKVAECEKRKLAIKDQTQLALRAAPAIVVCAAEESGQDPGCRRGRTKESWCQSFVKGECTLPKCPFAHLDKQEVETLLRQSEKRRLRNLERVEKNIVRQRLLSNSCILNRWKVG